MSVGKKVEADLDRRIAVLNYCSGVGMWRDVTGDVSAPAENHSHFIHWEVGTQVRPKSGNNALCKATGEQERSGHPSVI